MDKELDVFKVVRVPPMGKLVVESRMKRFDKLSQVTDSSLRQQILAAIGELVVFVDGYDTLVQAGLAPPPSGAGQSGAPYASSVEERQRAFLDQMEIQRNEAILQAQQDRISGKDDAPADAASLARIDSGLTLAEQIDLILQKYLADDPALVGRIVHLENAPEGGLRIRVDDKYYEQPKDLDDGRVRRAIMLALREWETGT